MSLYQKHRPKTLEGIIGNDATVKKIAADFAKDRRDQPHAILLSGPTGCGKTTIARIIAAMLKCSDSDFREVDSADFRGIDTIRDMRQASRHKSIRGDSRVWLLDECHKLTNDAQNALLKTLEDPPAHVYFILATTDPQKLLPTVKGRCAHYIVEPLEDEQMMRLLKRIVKREEKDVPKKVLEQIVLDSQGQSRNALQILDQIINLKTKDMLEAAKRSAEEQSQTIELCRALFKRAPWKEVSRILVGMKDQDPERIRYAVMGYANSILLKSDNKMAAAMIEAMSEPFYNMGAPGLTLACYALVK